MIPIDSLYAAGNVAFPRCAPGTDLLLALLRLESVFPAVADVLANHESQSSSSPEATPSPGRSDAANAAVEQDCVRWITASAGGDARAFEHFYHATVRYAQAVARRIVSSSLLDDVLAETYLQAWRQSHLFDGVRGNPIAWIVTIARSRALDRLRQERVRHAGQDGAVESDSDAIEAESVVDAETLLQATQTNSALHRAIAALSVNERWCVGLAYYRDMTHGEIASFTALPLGTVKSLLTRAQQKLRFALTEASTHGSRRENLQ